jgi:hypothetical protein
VFFRFGGHVMKTATRATVLALTAVMGMYADIIYLGPVSDAGGGFGSILTMLTLQSPGNQSTSSGCSGIGGSGQSAIGSEVCPDGFIGGDESGPAGFPKNETFSVATVGAAADIGIVYNSSQPGGTPVTIDAMALSLFNSTGTIVGTFGGIVCAPGATAGTCNPNGSVTLDFTDPGVGNAGFLFALTGDQADAIQALVNGDQTLRAGFAASFSSEVGGLETFSLVDLNRGGEDPVIPEPGTYTLLGSGLIGLMYWTHRRRA